LVLNVREGGDYWGGFGLGHLWFILFLLVLSLVALPLFLWGRGEKGSAFMRKFCRALAHPLGALLAAFVILVGDALPDLEGLNPFYYLAFFVLGYVAFCSTEFAVSAERYRWPALLLGTGLSVFWVATWEWRDSLPDPSIERAVATYFGMLATWLVIAGLIGWGRRYLDWTSDRLSYHAEASYPIYILHQTVIVILAWYVVRLAVAWQLQWTVLFLASIAVTFAAYEVVRRVSPLRFFFGMRPKKT
ncbi:MAG: acyltransferase family protein, partial [Coriobacteriia bacterium]|nr:acyltransferase family protein [Coriobacteriia bacterium]